MPCYARKPPVIERERKEERKKSLRETSGQNSNIMSILRGFFRSIECSITIIVSSATALHSLWTKPTVISPFYTKVKSLCYQKSLHMRGHTSSNATSGRGTSEELINVPMGSISMDGKGTCVYHSTGNNSPRVPPQAVNSSNVAYDPLTGPGVHPSVVSPLAVPSYVVHGNDMMGWHVADHQMV